MKKTNLFWGIVLIGLGILLLGYNLFGFDLGSINSLWPLLILLMGVFFEWSFIGKKKNPGLLVPGGIFLVLGILFEFETITAWNYSAYTWPLYPFAVAFGLFQLYLFSNRPRPLLIPVAILLGVTVLAYVGMIFNVLSALIDLGLFIPLILIFVGLIILVRR